MPHFSIDFDTKPIYPYSTLSEKSRAFFEGISKYFQTPSLKVEETDTQETSKILPDTIEPEAPTNPAPKKVRVPEIVPAPVRKGRKNFFARSGQ